MDNFVISKLKLLGEITMFQHQQTEINQQINNIVSTIAQNASLGSIDSIKERLTSLEKNKKELETQINHLYQRVEDAKTRTIDKEGVNENLC